MKKLKNWFIGDYLARTPDVFERARIELTYSYSMFFIVMGLAFYGNLIAQGLWYHFYVITFACASLIAIPFILKYKQSLRLAANWYVIQQTITSALSVVLQEFEPDMAGSLWTMSFILYIFFVFGVKKGLLRILPFTLLFLLTLYNAMQQEKFDFGIPEDQKLPNFPVFTLVPFSLCLYIIITFVRTRGAAEKELEVQRSLLETRNREVTDSIAYAQRIQQAILPSHRMIEAHFPESFMIFMPKDIVSGDFYWMSENNGKVLFAVGDCTGHGVPGSIMSVISQNCLNRAVFAYDLHQPADILNKTNDLVEAILSRGGSVLNDGMDIAFCSYDKKTNAMEYAGANNPVYIVSNGELKEIKANKQPIGRFESKIPFTNHSVELKKGDCVYLFSDGIADQFGGPDGKKFKYKRLKELLIKASNSPVREQKNKILDSFVQWKGKLEQIDDICILGIKI